MNLSSRRSFIKTAGLGAAVLGLARPHMVWASPVEARSISFEACQAMDCAGVAESSPMVQKSWKYLQQEIAALKNDDIRVLVKTILDNPVPLLAQRLDEKNRRAVWQELTAKGYTTQSEEAFLPPVPANGKAAMPFYVSPGSGYQSHHAYPGGLATHVATNAALSRAIVTTYQNVYGYDVDADVAMAAQLLHDLHKPYVFQWQADASSRTEQPLAKTGEHHVLSIAESIVRKAPAALVVAQACAHTHPGTAEDEAQVVGWIKAAAIIAGVDPVTSNLLAADGNTLPLPRRQEGFICHLADHDFVLSVPAVKWTLPVIGEIAASDYGLSANDMKGKPFNSLRNTVYANLSAMQIHEAYATEGKEGVRRLMHAVVRPSKA